MSDETNETPNEPTPDSPENSSDTSKPKGKGKASKKKTEDVPAAPETPEPASAEAPSEPPAAETPAETPSDVPEPAAAEAPSEPEPAPAEPASVLDELSNRTEEPAAESRNELVFDPSSGELVVKPKGESVGSDAVIVSDIADEGFFAEGW